jgi:hypothetical protein
MSTGGRPTKYDNKFAEQAKLLCRLGATNPELAEFFEVVVSTIHDWRAAHPEFHEAIRQGKEMADARVANALFHRAVGYKHKALKFFAHEGTSWSEEYVEHYPPDAASCIFWLKNRRPDLWRDQREVINPQAEKIEKVSPADRVKILEASRAVKKEA